MNSFLLVLGIAIVSLAGCAETPEADEEQPVGAGKADSLADHAALPRAIARGTAELQDSYSQVEWDSFFDDWKSVYWKSDEVDDADVIVSCNQPADGEISCSLWYAAWHGKGGPARHTLSTTIESDGSFAAEEIHDKSTSYSEGSYSFYIAGFVDGDRLVVESGGYSMYNDRPHASISKRRVREWSSRTLNGPIETTFATGTRTDIARGGHIFSPHPGLTTFFASDAPHSADDASAACAGMSGGHLAQFAFADPALELAVPHWIGLRRADATSEFLWFDGQPLHGGAYPQYGTYWAEGEPSDVGNCVVTDPEDGRWHAVPCDDTHPMLCQFDAQTALSEED